MGYQTKLELGKISQVSLRGNINAFIIGYEINCAPVKFIIDLTMRITGCRTLISHYKKSKRLEQLHA